MKQSLFAIPAMIGCAYICTSIVFWPELIEAQTNYSTVILVLYHACPWILTYLSIKGWYQSFVWRRMVEARAPAPTLSRGDHRFDVQKKHSRLLERLSLIFLILALCALWEIWL